MSSSSLEKHECENIDGCDYFGRNGLLFGVHLGADRGTTKSRSVTAIRERQKSRRVCPQLAASAVIGYPAWIRTMNNPESFRGCVSTALTWDAERMATPHGFEP